MFSLLFRQAVINLRLSMDALHARPTPIQPQAPRPVARQEPQVPVPHTGENAAQRVTADINLRAIDRSDFASAKVLISPKDRELMASVRATINNGGVPSATDIEHLKKLAGKLETHLKGEVAHVTQERSVFRLGGRVELNFDSLTKKMSTLTTERDHLTQQLGQAKTALADPKLAARLGISQEDVARLQGQLDHCNAKLTAVTERVQAKLDRVGNVGKYMASTEGRAAALTAALQSPEVARKLAGNPKTDQAMLEKLATHYCSGAGPQPFNAEIAAQLLTNKHTPAGALATIIHAEAGNTPQNQALATVHPNASSGLLQEIGANALAQVKLMVAPAPQAPVSAMYPLILAKVAAHDQAPGPLLAAIAQAMQETPAIKDAATLAALAKNPRTPLEPTLTALCGSADRHVLANLLERRDLPVQGLEALLRNPAILGDPKMLATAQARALDNPNTPEKQAARKDTTPEQLTALATKHGQDKLVVIALINNPQTPAAALAKLLDQNASPDIRRAIAHQADTHLERVQAQINQASIEELGLALPPDAPPPSGEPLLRLQAEHKALLQVKATVAKDPSANFASVTTPRFDALGQPILKQPQVVTPQGGLEVPLGVQPMRIPNPGMRARVAETFTAGGVTFNRGDPCIVVERDGQKYIQQVKDKGTLMRSKYVVEDQLIKLDRDSQVTGVSAFEGPRWREQSFVKTDQPLFDGPISPKAIKQGGLGDCYVIASLYTIADQEPEAIHQMIKDNGDGTVTVRLFDKPSPRQFEMTDEAFSQLKARQAEFNLSDAQLAVLGARGSKTEAEFTALVDDVSGLAKARAAVDAYERPGGKPNPLKKTNKAEYDKVLSGLRAEKQKCALLQEQLSKGLARMTETLTPKYITFEKSTLEGNQHVSGALWGQMLEKAYAIHLGSYEKMGGGGTDATISRMSNVFETLLGRTSERMYLWTEVGKLEGGEIDPYAAVKSEKVFRTLTQALERGQLVGAATETAIGVSQGSGGSAGEAMVDGLAGGHAYGVLGTTEIAGRKFVRVANPWGTEFARDYTMVKGADGQVELVAKKFDKKDYSYLPESATQKGAGIGVNESWMEWDDFVANFKDLYFTN